MYQSPRLVLVASLIALSTGVSLMGDAQATTAIRSFVQNATGACQAALPAFEGLVRKRPLAVQNEGGSLAYVSCSLMSTDKGVGTTRSMYGVYIGFINYSGAPVDVTCTLVDGVANSGSNASIAKTVSVPVTGYVQLGWTSGDNGGSNFLYTTNASCALPPGTGVSYTWAYYSEDVGA